MLFYAAEMNASGLFDSIRSILEEYEPSIVNVKGQGYDGCSTMSGCYSGVQARMKDAYFVHCYSHRLNLVVIDTCPKNKNIRNFFGTVGRLYDFIEGSTKQHALFKTIQETLDKESGSETTHKKTSFDVNHTLD